MNESTGPAAGPRDLFYPDRLLGFDMSQTTEASSSLVSTTEVDALIDSIFGPLPADVAAAGREHLAAGGGRLRAQVALAAGEALGLNQDARSSIAAACELVHNAALVHDDLQDRDSLRRGRPAIWHSHGEDVALMLGDFFLSAAHAAMATSRSRVASDQLHAAVAETITGQVADRAACYTPLNNLERYEQIAKQKSGALIALALTAPLAAAGFDHAIADAYDAGRRYAVGYQMRDDIADIDDDAARPGRAERLNAVFVIARARCLTESDAVIACRARAVEHCEAAQAKAAALPAGAGDALAEVSQRLACPLRQSADAA